MTFTDSSLFAYLNFCITCWSFLIIFVIVCWCFRVFCIVIPSSLAWLVSAIAVSFICNVMLCVDGVGWKIENCVLVGLGTRLLLWKYVIRLWSSVCANVCSSVSVLAVMIKVVSSAYVYTFEFGTVLIMLFMYSKKKVVERVLPCGIPCVMVCVFDCACCVWSDCLRFLKYEVKNAMVSGVKLNSFFSLLMSLLCDMVSYALERSIYTASVGLCLLL